MATAKNGTKTITRYYAVLKEDFTYNYYGTYTIKKGRTFNLRNYRLLKEGLIFVLGHGADEIIPMDKLRLVEETETIVTEVKKTKKAWKPEWREPKARKARG